MCKVEVVQFVPRSGIIVCHMCMYCVHVGSRIFGGSSINVLISALYRGEN